MHFQLVSHWCSLAKQVDGIYRIRLQPSESLSYMTKALKRILIILIATQTCLVMILAGLILTHQANSVKSKSISSFYIWVTWSDKVLHKLRGNSYNLSSQ
jgi:hypothetical protein